MATLQYNDITGGQGILQGQEDLCGLGDGGITGDDSMKKKFTRYNNGAMSEIWKWIFFACGKAQYDDGNQTNLPSAAQNLVTTTNKYAIPTEALSIKRIESLYDGTIWEGLDAVRETDIETLGEFGRLTGRPSQFKWRGKTIELDVISDKAVTNGFKVFFDRAGMTFSYSDTTAVPGFISEFHEAVVIGGAIRWLKINKPDSNTLVAALGDWKQFSIDIPRYYRERFKALQDPAFGQEITEFH